MKRRADVGGDDAAAASSDALIGRMKRTPWQPVTMANASFRFSYPSAAAPLFHFLFLERVVVVVHIVIVRRHYIVLGWAIVCRVAHIR